MLKYAHDARTTWTMVVLLLLGCCTALSHPPRLRFRPGGVFKIVQLTDLHLGESVVKDEHTLQVIRAVLKAEQDADLIVFSGDMVSGFMNKYSKSGWFESIYDSLLSVVTRPGIPHAMILGNHDDEGMLSRADIVEIDRLSPLSVTQLGPSNLTGTTNYWVDIESSVDGRSAGRLWLLDSLDRGCAGIPGWGCVAPDTVSWVNKTSSMLPQVPVSAAFVHIPVPEFIEAWNHGVVKGSKMEPVCCPSCNTGLASTLKKAGIDAIYSGHDHDNDFDAVWNGMRYVYGRKTGYGSYGPEKGLKHGARIIILRENQSTLLSESYIRLQDASWLHQGPAWKPFWKRGQLSCNSGAALRRALISADLGNTDDGLAIHITHFGTCTAKLAATV